MKNVKTSILAVLLMAIIAITPVMAGTDIANSGNAAYGVNGDLYQSALAINTGDHSNLDFSENDNSRAYIDSSTTVVNEAGPRSASYYGLDIPTVEKTITTVYEGQVIVTPLDKDVKVFSQPGDAWKFNIQASVPVLAYVINSIDTDKAKWDLNCAPQYDAFAEKFKVGNLDKIYMSQYRSPQQSFEVTAKKPGRYSLVIDTRVAHFRNGIFGKMTDDSVDVIYSMEKVKNGTPEDNPDYKPISTTFIPDPSTYIGTIDTVPVR